MRGIPGKKIHLARAGESLSTCYRGIKALKEVAFIN